MSTTAPTPATPPMPVHLSAPELETFLLPHLSLPKRGPQCNLGYDRVLNLIVWVLYTGMPWKCLPVPPDAQGQPASPYTTIDTGVAKWADDGSLWPAFVASVRHRAAEKQLELRVLHGDGTTTVAKKGAMGWATRATSTKRVPPASRSSTTRALSERRSPWLRSMKQIWSCYRRACKR
jgi:transposase